MTIKKCYKEKERVDHLWTQLWDLSWAGRDETSEKTPDKKATKKEKKGLDILKKRIRSVAAFNDIDVTEIY